jgi:hypothetical protein
MKAATTAIPAADRATGQNVWNRTEVELRVTPMSAGSPGKIDEYFNLIQRELELRLELSRLQNTDTEAKGVAAERFLGEILQRYLEPSHPTYRRQIIDSTGASSGEVDLIFCNLAQPSVHTELLLAEGVDYAIGAKSVLTKPEIKSLTRNAESVKRLRRRLGAGEAAYASDKTGPLFLDRIPYIGFALESRLSFKTVHKYVAECASELDPELQADAVFVLGRGAMINSRRRFRVSGELVPGWIGLPFPDRVLLEFLNFAIGLVPRVVRSGVALKPYLNQVASLRSLPTAETDGMPLMGTDEE